jgi:hypothetical protein
VSLFLDKHSAGTRVSTWKERGKCMSGKRMHIRRCKDGSYRIRLYHAHEDQIETIQLALETARRDSPSEFDVVLLELVCMTYLALSRSTEG